MIRQRPCPVPRLTLVPPTSDDAFDEYKIALDYGAEYLGGSFEPESRGLSLARLIVHWLRGVPLSVIIDNRARWRRDQGQQVSYPGLIRKVMADVEDIARIEAPRCLSCYAEVVAQAAGELGRQIDADAVTSDRMSTPKSTPDRLTRAERQLSVIPECLAHESGCVGRVDGETVEDVAGLRVVAPSVGDRGGDPAEGVRVVLV